MARNSGNALFMILIAIFLLGALTALVARTSGTTEETGDTERQSIQASDIVRTASGMKAAVDLLLSRGCSMNQLSFWADTNNDGAENGGDLHYNPSAPTDRSCHIFQVAGAGMPYKKLPDAYFANVHTYTNYGYPMFNANSQVSGIGTQCAAGSCSELMMWITDITPELCWALNRRLGIPLDDVPEQVFDWTYDTWYLFDGNYTNTGNNTVNSVGDESGNAVRGKMMGCIKRYDWPPNAYEFFAVLIAR